jgi:hypothetical protein
VVRPAILGWSPRYMHGKNTTSNELDLILDFDVSYWLLTELLAPQELQDREDDTVPAPSESWSGSLSGLAVPA